MGIWTLKKKRAKIDEHDQPTEPVPTDVIPGSAFPTVNSTPQSYDTVPVPHANKRIFYPVPPAPLANATPSQPEQQEREPAYAGWGWGMSQRMGGFPLRLLPLGVGLCFVGTQLLLLMRFVCKVWNLAPGGGWVEAVYNSSDILLLPFQILLPPLHQALFTRIEPYTLLAVVLYGFCSRILVRILKMIVHVHRNIDKPINQDSSASKTAGRTN